MPAIFSPTPRRFISLQRLGVATSDPTVPTGGTDVSTTLQAIANDTSAYNVIVCDGGHYKGRVQLLSGRGIEGTGGRWDGTAGAAPKTGLIHPATSNYAITNANWRSPVVSTNGLTSGTTVESMAYSQVVDHDITIRNLHIHGNRGNAVGASGYDPSGLVAAFLVTPFGTGSSASNTGDLRRCCYTINGVSLGDLIYPMMIRGCRNLSVENVSVYNPGSYALSTSYVDGSFVSNLWVYCPGATSGLQSGSVDTFGNLYWSACWQLNGPHRTVRARDLSGTTYDDFFACNANDGGQFNTNGSAATQAAAYWTVIYKGPISDVTVNGINSYACKNVVRLLATDANCVIDGVVIDNVRATAFGEAVVIINGLGTNTGTPIGSVCLSNWAVNCNLDTSYDGLAIETSLNIRSLLLSNFTVKDTSGTANALGFINVSAGTLSNLILNGVLVDGWQNILAMTGGTLSNCVVGNCIHFNKGSGNYSIYTTGGSPGKLSGKGNIGITQGGGASWSDATKFESA
jgi:hypothetical protein